MKTTMTPEELAALGVTTSIPIAGRAFGLGRTASYDLNDKGDFPCRVIPVGSGFRVPTADLREALGITA